MQRCKNIYGWIKEKNAAWNLSSKPLSWAAPAATKLLSQEDTRGCETSLPPGFEVEEQEDKGDKEEEEKDGERGNTENVQMEYCSLLYPPFQRGTMAVMVDKISTGLTI